MKKTASTLFTVLVVMLLIALSCAGAAEKYVITDLGTLGGSQSFAYGINDSGQIVGDSWYSGDAGGGPFFYSKGTMVDLNAVYGIGPGYYASAAEDINNLGQIVGNSSAGHAVVLGRGMTTDLGTFGGTFSSALGINNWGRVVGYFVSPDGYHRAFSYGNGVATELGPFGIGASSVAAAINDSGMIVGIATDSYEVPSHAFLYSNGVMTDISPFGNSESYARGINNHGQVVGDFLTADATAFHCFLYHEGSMVDLGTLNGPDCVASAINERGEVVGTSPVQVGTETRCDYATNICTEYPVYSWHGFLYKNGKMTDLNTLIPPDSGWELMWASDINKKGQIVGYGTANNIDGVNRAFLLTPVLEVTIDIRPWSRRNPISYKGHGILPVVILSAEDFDAPRQVDQRSLTFGATGNETSLAFCNRKPKSVHRHGSKDDLVCYFYVDLGGFKCGDTEGILKGMTLSGLPIEGEDLVRITGCR